LDHELLSATLTKEQVKNSPDFDTDKPISRQYEMQYLKYYRNPNYWGSTGLWGVGVNPNLMPMNSGVDWSADQYRQAEIDRQETGRREHHEQLVARSPRAHRAAVDRRCELVRLQSLCWPDASGGEGCSSV
jgi:stress response protein YsnF